ncbi:MAG: hypothetical protein ABSD74_02345 [Rhizomicrobium sp.]
MPLSSNEAAQTLRDISRTEQRSANAHGYRAGSPHLIVWGVIWAIGYSVNYFRPGWSIAWIPLVILGTIASFIIGARTRPESSTMRDWRYAATLVAAILFISALLTVLPPKSDLQIAAFFPILVALFYTLIGIWTKGVRMILLGLAIGALAMIVFFKAPETFALWMAGVGGGGLILGGVWLRSV